MDIVESCQDAYASTVKRVLELGEIVDERDDPLSVGAGRRTRELASHQVTIANPRRRFFSRNLGAFDLELSIARFLWMMSGSDRLEDIAFYTSSARRFSDDGITIPGSSFGRRLFSPRPGLDQIAGIIDRLRSYPGTRRAVAVIYQPEDAVRRSVDIPCALAVAYRIRGDKLHATTLMRSNNALRVMAYDLFEFSMLAEVIATEIGIPLGCLTHYALSMHIYEDEITSRTDALSEAATGGDLEMPLMPSNPKPLEELSRLCRSEAAMRHSGPTESTAEVRRLMSQGASLSVYWRQLYLVLLHASARRSGCTEALALIKGEMDARYLAIIGRQ